MSLITTNNITLEGKAIISLKAKTGKQRIETKGDLTIVSIDNEPVALNIFNYSKYFSAHEGTHTLNQEQKDAIEKLGFTFKDDFPFFTIGEIIAREAHPKSDHLFILKVKTEKELQIITNSTNSLVGTKVVVARVGAVLPSGMHITFSKVMGTPSEGMLCGGETLGKGKTDGVLLVEGNPGEEYIL